MKCKLVIHNQNSPHLHQIYAGFIELKNQKIIDLEKEVLNDSNYSYLEVILDDRYKIIYDTMDSGERFVENLSWNEIDYYFKRSYDKNIANEISNKIYPLGLNYEVNSQYGNIRELTLKQRIKEIIKFFIGKQSEEFTFNDFEEIKVEPTKKICFLTRFWDVNSIEIENEFVRQERKEINEFRAKCIRICKDRYGENFIGGAQKDLFALESYPDCIVQDTSITNRREFIKIAKGSKVCVTTTGLHKSIGWKFAEFVSMGKAIVTEELFYEVPGNLEEGENYLVFKTPEELVEKIDILLSNDDLIDSMENKNEQYYKKYVRADKMIYNTLKFFLDNK